MNVSMISYVFLTCPSLFSIQDLRLQRIAPIKSNQLSLHVKPAGKREQVSESLFAPIYPNVAHDRPCLTKNCNSGLPCSHCFVH